MVNSLQTNCSKRRCNAFQILVVCLSFLAITQDDVHAQRRIRFSTGRLSLKNSTVPRHEILAGGQPKDGIPAITNPEVISASQATFLKPQAAVIGVALRDEARAWPIAILNYHEVVNDRLAGIPIAVTYCPLCDSAVVFDRRTQSGVREFGVSGLLYNSNVLMYDRGSFDQSLWSQLGAQAISGPAVTESLTILPLDVTTWEEWRSRFPKTTVMSPRTSHPRDYSRNPYARYFQTSQLMFPVRRVDKRLPPKQPVLGLSAENQFVAIPMWLMGKKPLEFDVEVGTKHVRLITEPNSSTIRVDQADEGVQWAYSFWFAWYAFHPETVLFQPETD